MVKEVFLITGNQEKFEAAKQAFEGTETRLKQVKSHDTEIQASNSLEIAAHTVEQVIENYNKPVIREDHSVYLNAIPGFPGPYMSYFDENVPAERLLEILEGEDKTGYFEIATVLGMPSGKIKKYTSKIEIEIAEEIRGRRGNWERIMMLKGENSTFSETDKDSRIEQWNKNFRKIAEEISSTE